MEVRRESIEQWEKMIKSEGCGDVALPITLYAESGSMQPMIRIDIDAVTVVPCSLKEVEVGDIVLVKAPQSSAGYVLHRLLSKTDKEFVTLGDACTRPDRTFYKEELLGKAVRIRGPKKDIDCNTQAFKTEGARIVRNYKLRPMASIPRRGVAKIKRIIKQWM